MIRKILFCLFLLPLPMVWGQGVFVGPFTSFRVVNGVTMPNADATITVCAAGAGGIPCSPALTNAIYSDLALTNALSNPFLSDANGNYSFAVGPDNYTITETAVGFAGKSFQITTSGGTGSGIICGTTCTPNTLALFTTSTAVGNSHVTDSGGILGTTDGYFELGVGGVGTYSFYTPSGSGVRLLAGGSGVLASGNSGGVQISTQEIGGSSNTSGSINIFTGAAPNGSTSGSINITTGSSGSDSTAGEVVINIGSSHDIITIGHETIWGSVGGPFIRGLNSASGTGAQIFFGNGTPSGNCPNGDSILYLRNDAGNASQVAYICQANTWTAIAVP